MNGLQEIIDNLRGCTFSNAPRVIRNYQAGKVSLSRSTN